MTFKDLHIASGESFHFMYDANHICKDDNTPVYYLIDYDNWLTICQQDDIDDGLWRGEWDYKGECLFTDYIGRKSPREVFDSLMAQHDEHINGAVAREGVFY